MCTWSRWQSSRFPLKTVAVCDIWSLARERRAAQVKEAFRLDPQSYKYSEEMLAGKDIDGVMIATGDFQHAKLCAEVVRAGKDCYVEKPFANVLSEAKETRDAVKAFKTGGAGGSPAPQRALSASRSRHRSLRPYRGYCPYRTGMNVNEERWRL